MNKASGGDGIPAELFQILKDDAVAVIHSYKLLNLFFGDLLINTMVCLWEIICG